MDRTLIYLIQDLKKEKTFQVHVSRLRFYHDHDLELNEQIFRFAEDSGRSVYEVEKLSDVKPD